jgi:hypothetical protein
MSDPSAISSPGRRRALLVTLSWGQPDAGFGGASFAEGGVARYTTWSDPVVLSGQRFEPLEGIEVELPRESLSLEPEPFTLRMPRGVEPFKTVVRRAHPPIDVRVEEIDVDDALVRRILAWGEILERDFVLGTAAPGDGGGGGVVDARCATLKHKLRASLGLIASPICNWDPGRGECARTMTLEEISTTGVVTAIDGLVVTIDVLTTNPVMRGVAQPSGWARFGAVRRGSILLDVLDHDTASGKALLSAEPPAGWIDRLVTVTAGCPGDAAACAARFNNIERFGGYGHALPDYNPAFSSGRS